MQQNGGCVNLKSTEYFLITAEEMNLTRAATINVTSINGRTTISRISSRCWMQANKSPCRLIKRSPGCRRRCFAGSGLDWSIRNLQFSVTSM